MGTILAPVIGVREIGTRERGEKGLNQSNEGKSMPLLTILFHIGID